MGRHDVRDVAGATRQYVHGQCRADQPQLGDQWVVCARRTDLVGYLVGGWWLEHDWNFIVI